jgi:hypothetical protein
MSSGFVDINTSCPNLGSLAMNDDVVVCRDYLRARLAGVLVGGGVYRGLINS